MILLTSTTDKLQVITGSAGTIDVHVSYVDLGSGGAVTTGRTNTKITTATTTDILAPPAASTTRNAKTIAICNNHATNSCLVTFQHTDGTNIIPIELVTLLPNERLAYTEGVGIRVIDATGVEKNNQAPVQGSYTVNRLGADVSNSTVTAAKITGLDLVCNPGTWLFEYFIVYQSGTVTTGIKWSVNHTGTVTSFVYNAEVVTADITTNTALADQDVLLTTGATKSAWAARAKSNAATMISSGVDTITADMLLKVEGLAIVTVGGNMEFWHASEVATATTVKAGSAVRLTKVG